MKTILLENWGIADSFILDFCNKLDPDYVEINSEIRNYMREDDLRLFGLFINKDLENIVTSSTFEHTIERNSHYNLLGFNEDDWELCKQLGYFTWLIFNAVRFRKRISAPHLNIYINYRGHSFLESLKEGRFGETTSTYLSLMLRQQDNVSINLLDEWTGEVKKTLKNEEDLNL